ncbi:putative fatty acid-binding protein, adipocyte-like [Apostichopus japonicus]|uniref:Putative fatty acid-binding protein, adipocyte-like n=1 Tax=Stichopus japonicus TaxID=307972 RepID=A0A2G8K9H7_STIJA|nr:putative fatty acid-binding protein, adipocyte-like [Apostichopus japonicus]
MALKQDMNFNGTWQLVNSHNLQPFLKACGVSFMRRNLAKAVSPLVYITQDGDKFTIRTDTVHRSITQNFCIGVAFKCCLPWEAEECLMIARWEGNKLVVQLVDDEEKRGPVFVRYLEDDQLVLEQEMDNVLCKRYFKKK